MAISERLRGWARPLLAVLVVLTLLIPTLDAFQCVVEFSDVTVASVDKHQAETVIAKDISGKPLDVTGDADPLCPHGHCQHPAGIPSVAEPVAMPITLAYFEPFRSVYSVPASQPPLGLLRPPRA
jgi:hypothetical protein